MSWQLCVSIRDVILFGMILSTHAVVGAAAASLIPDHPALGFSIGFASHFLLDVIPHWDYKLYSMVKNPENPMQADMRFNRKFLIDIAKISFDGLLGILSAVLLFGMSGPVFFLAALCGAAGGVAPDALQFAYFKWPHEPLSSIQRFHIRIHAKKRFENRAALGLSLQLLLVLASVALVMF